MTTVCLTMIVKNEEAIIERCLRSVLPYVDGMFIIDTGSTDSTIDKIESILDDENIDDFNYGIAQRPWVDFSTNRNEALAMALGSGCDYLLMLDADQELVARDLLFEKKLSLGGFPAYNIWNYYGNLRMAKTCLLRTDVVLGKSGAKYVGVTHEVLMLPEDIRAETLPREMIRIVDHADGSNRKDKFQRDFDLLMQAHLDYGEGNDSRTVFYIAQTLKDMGDYATAQKWYEIRIQLGGWEEECWYAQYQRARMNELMNDKLPDTVTHDYLMAYARRPWRAEPLWHLAQYWRGRNEMPLYHMFAWQASQIRVPRDVLLHDDVLFIERDCYPVDLAEAD